ncbi:MAG TPA: prolipoprotein diacylglyceryl transferase family protein [Symbiobacteriaceae bacterium]|nr:prolipoprotein diacylglyceryl transferase family protein [Symbiobacteriaceae bacterium]
MPNLNPLAVTGLLGGLLAYWLTGFLARRAGADRDAVSAAQDIVPNLVIGGVLGAKLLYVLLDPQAYVANPLLLVIFPYGTWALPAGLAGGLLAVAWGLRRQPDWRRVLDLVAGPLAVGLAIALVGWKAPGSWAFAPLVGVAGLGAIAAGPEAARTVVLVAGAIALADQARPAGTVSPVQLLAAVIGTTAWLWLRIQAKKNPGA